MVKDILNQRNQLDAHRRTLAVYLQREALQGAAHVDPEVVNGIQAARAGIARCKATLRRWGVAVDDLPDDADDDVDLEHPPMGLTTLRWPVLGGGSVGAVVLIAVIAAILLRAPATNISGDNSVINTGTIERLEIHTGDAPEVRQQKAAQAKRLIVQDALANIGSLDARLGYVSAVLTPRADPLQSARQMVAPASQAVAEAGYRQLIAAQQSAALRQSLNGRPLRLEFGAPLVQVLIDSGTDADNVRNFYDELAATNDATESLLSTLDGAARDSGDEMEDALWASKIGLARDTLRNRSQTAYLLGQRVLHSMGATADDTASLALLRELEPRQLADPAAVTQALHDIAQETIALTQRRQTIIEHERQQIATIVGAYQQINEELVIQPSDTQEQVVKKARSLRDLGRTDEAVAAFARYGALFQADPSAVQYAHVAQAFTRQMADLGVGGGAYIFGVADGSAAQRAGIAIGDILISYNGQPITDADQVEQAVLAAPAGAEVSIEWLRIDPSGRLMRQQAHVQAGKLGVAMMLI